MEEKIYLEDTEITIVRKKIKNMHMYIRPPMGEVLITAPLRVPYGEIERFVFQKRDWITENVEKMKNTEVTPDPVYKDKDVLMIWGELYELSVFQGTRYSLTLTEDISQEGRKIARLCVRAG